MREPINQPRPNPGESNDPEERAEVRDARVKTSFRNYLATGQRESAAAFEHGEWLGNGRVGGAPRRELFGGTLGLIGFGHIGREVARRAEAFGLRVQAIRSKAGPEALPALLSTSDFVVVACPLTPETKGMLTGERLRLMKPNAILVNVARAEIVQCAGNEFLASARLPFDQHGGACGRHNFHLPKDGPQRRTATNDFRVRPIQAA